MYEHGLFHMSVNKGEAMRNYRTAKMAGHPQAAGVKQSTDVSGKLACGELNGEIAAFASVVDSRAEPVHVRSE